MTKLRQWLSNELDEGEKAELAPILAGELPAQARVVSKRVLRRVLRFELETGRVVYAKQHLFPFLRVRLRYALRAGPATRERRGLERARERGLVVPRPLALRAARGLLGPRLAVLVTEALPTDRARAVDASSLVRVLDALEAASVLHPDVHRDNVRMLGDDPAFLDFQSVRFARVSARDRMRMLAKFVASSAPALRAALPGELFASAQQRAQFEQALDALGAASRASRRRHRLRSSSAVVRERVGRFGQRLRLRTQDARSFAAHAFGPPTPFRVDERFGRHTRSVSNDGRIVRIEGRLTPRGTYRELWARDSENEAFLAWSRNAPWPWATQALYIQAQPQLGQQ